jgi:hypothetical protein
LKSTGFFRRISPLFGLRKDFMPAVKLQREDDISASVTVPDPATSTSAD